MVKDFSSPDCEDCKGEDCEGCEKCKNCGNKLPFPSDEQLLERFKV